MSQSYQICDHQQKRENQDHHSGMFTVREMHGAGKSGDIHGTIRKSKKELKNSPSLGPMY